MNVMRISVRRSAAAVAAIGLTAAVAACADGGSSDPAADNDTLKIVASTPIWGDIAKELAEDAGDDAKKIDVVSIMQNSDDDPHEYEATARDLAELKDADIIAANGAGYDNWLTDNAKDVPVVSALPLAAAHHHHHDHDHEGHDHEHDHEDHDHEGHDHEGHDHEGHDHGDQNPHAWLDMDIVNAFADNLASQINKIDGDFPAEVSDDSGLKKKTEEFTKRLKDLPAKNVILTEPVAEAAVDDSSLEDVTPESFADAVAREAEPSAGDLASTRDLITTKDSKDGRESKSKVDILITNEQSQTPAAEQLVSAAKDSGVAIVNINETPDQGDTYFDYVDKFLKQLEDA